MHPLHSAIQSARNIVVFTGAGVSTESGIPDFRSKGGIWERFRIIEYQEFVASEEARKEDWARRFYMENEIQVTGPNIAHKTIANWVKTGKCSKLITQNVDGLHQEAGTPQDAIIEVHGNAKHAKCISCNTRYEISTCREMFEATGNSPRCTKCDGIIKSAVIMFGQQMPEHAMNDAYQASKECDLFIAIGTSLQVFPAANLPLFAKANGAQFGIINRDPTQLDSEADFVMNCGIGEAFETFSSDT